METTTSGTTLGAPPRAASGTVLGAVSRSASSSVDSSVSSSSNSAAKKKKKRTKAPAGEGMASSGSRHVIKTEREWIEGMSSEEEEEEEEYKRGGYHPVNIGNVFNNRYKIVSKLGWGHFSTVWLATDMKTNNTAALKIVKSARHYTEAARDEVAILKKVTDNDPNNNKCIVHLLDSFDHNGPNGTHVCMAFENLGCNLLTVIRMYKYKGLPIPLVKIITKQILVSLDYLHRRCGIIHTDLKPENVLLLKTPNLVKTAKFSKVKSATDSADRMSIETARDKMDEDDTNESGRTNAQEDSDEDDNPGNNSRQGERDQATEAELATLPRTKEQLLEAFGEQSYLVKVVDLGNACWVDKHFTDDVQTRQYRAPEIILGQQYGPSIDMWSMGCIVFELLTGDMLFEPKSGRHFSKNDDHLAQMIELCGRMPRSMTQSGKYAGDYFNRRGELRNIRKLKPWPLADVLVQKYQFAEKDAKAISSFLMPMLEYDPDKRATARQSLQHEWVLDIDITKFESAFS